VLVDIPRVVSLARLGTYFSKILYANI
jgi:hypothetical protein